MLIKSEQFPSEFPTDLLQDEINPNMFRPNVFGRFYQEEVAINGLKAINGDGYEAPTGYKIGIKCEITLGNDRNTKVVYDIFDNQEGRELKNRFLKAWTDFENKLNLNKEEPKLENSTLPTQEIKQENTEIKKDIEPIKIPKKRGRPRKNAEPK